MIIINSCQLFILFLFLADKTVNLIITASANRKRGPSRGS
jgi:hypothetical protein